MLLNISDHQSIIDLQERFSECFPLLKIEFYDKPVRCGKQPAHQQLPSNLRLGDCRKTHDPGLLDIKSYFTTGRIEQDFKDIFGLYVQIFRQDGNRWVSTCHTKGLTLQQQSAIAQHTLRKAPQKQMAEAGDYGYH